LDILRKNDEARLHIDIAMKIDPFFFMYHSLSSMYYYHEGKLNESLDECLVVTGLNPNYRSGFFDLYLKQGEDIKAFEELQKIMLLDTLIAKNADVVKEIFSKSGITGLLNFMIELELKKSKPSFYVIAQWYAMQETKAEALKWLEKALDDNDPNILRINCNPYFDSLRSEPRFKAMIKKMGLSEYAKKE
jgi:tetratricopeptide (TPR) repeat protein